MQLLTPAANITRTPIAPTADTTTTTMAEVASDDAHQTLQRAAISCASRTPQQGLTLVHLSTQHKRFLGDRGCTQGSFRRC